MSSLLWHRELIESVPFVSNDLCGQLEQRAAETLFDDPRNDPSLTVVIRTCNEVKTLSTLLGDIGDQQYDREIELIVVDNESTDGTIELAKDYDAKVVSIPKDGFTYAKSLNAGMEAASHGIVALLVGHVSMPHPLTLHAGARHFASNNSCAATFGTTLPGPNASLTERLVAVDAYNRIKQPATLIHEIGLGVLAATGCMVSKRVWQELGKFDLRYQSGGEDTALAKKMLAEGYDIIFEPAQTVHHSHGLGPVGYLGQLMSWQRTLAGPQPLSGRHLESSRRQLSRIQAKS